MKQITDYEAEILAAFLKEKIDATRGTGSLFIKVGRDSWRISVVRELLEKLTK